MEPVFDFEEYGFSLDSVGEAIEELGYDLDALMVEESPIGTMDEAWDDRVIRDRFPDAIDVVGETDGAFILGRLTSLFGSVTLEEGEIEGTGFRVPMIVHRAGEEGGDPVAVAIAFDHYARAKFCSIPLSGDVATAKKIAREFWSLMLGDPESLEEEEVRVFNRETDSWICYGVADGTPFISEEEAEEEEIEELSEEPYGQDRYEDEADGEDRM
jgi:hypothetical protein